MRWIPTGDPKLLYVLPGDTSRQTHALREACEPWINLLPPIWPSLCWTWAVARGPAMTLSAQASVPFDRAGHIRFTRGDTPAQKKASLLCMQWSAGSAGGPIRRHRLLPAGVRACEASYRVDRRSPSSAEAGRCLCRFYVPPRTVSLAQLLELHTVWFLRTSPRCWFSIHTRASRHRLFDSHRSSLAPLSETRCSSRTLLYCRVSS